MIVLRVLRLLLVVIALLVPFCLLARAGLWALRVCGASAGTMDRAEDRAFSVLWWMIEGES